MAAGEDSDIVGLAGRYSFALLELADQRQQLDAVADDLRGLGRLLDESDDLTRLIRNPTFGSEQQSKAMAAILERAGAGDLTRRFVSVVAQNRRLFALPQMITTYLSELARRRGEVTANVVAANDLSDSHKAALIEALKGVAGAKVKIDVKIELELIGGLIVRVGSRMVDSSLRTKLQKLQFAMKGVA